MMASKLIVESSHKRSINKETRINSSCHTVHFSDTSQMYAVKLQFGSRCCRYVFQISNEKKYKFYSAEEQMVFRFNAFRDAHQMTTVANTSSGKLSQEQYDKCIGIEKLFVARVISQHKQIHSF